jgi:hypothetical protein
LNVTSSPSIYDGVKQSISLSPNLLGLATTKNKQLARFNCSGDVMSLYLFSLRNVCASDDDRNCEKFMAEAARNESFCSID